MVSETSLRETEAEGVRAHCHVNTNEGGDRFVGIKAGPEGGMAFFPIGYGLPETEDELRADIRNLIQVLSELTTREERVLAGRGSSAARQAEFPVNAYRTVIETYLAAGGAYYVERDPVYRTAVSGNIHWPRTVRRQRPLVQQKGGVSSFVYTEFSVRASEPDEAKLITRIHRFCVYEAFRRLGWLYVSHMPEPPGPHPDVKTSLAVLNGKLAATNDDRKRTLFQAMRDMLLSLDEEHPEMEVSFGTENFERVWEKLVDRAFGVRDKSRYFPQARWYLKYNKNGERRPLLPDTVMVWDGKTYVLDAKCYRYGCTGNPDHLPGSSSIHKQITYGEYIERACGIDPDALFNAFIMPYNCARNPFGLKGEMEVIGEAVGDWRENRKYYERIQGILVDTRHLMRHYAGNTEEEKQKLADCIETGLAAGPARGSASGE